MTNDIRSPSSKAARVKSLYSVSCILYSVFCILYSVFCILYSVLRMRYLVISTQHVNFEPWDKGAPEQRAENVISKRKPYPADSVVSVVSVVSAERQRKPTSPRNPGMYRAQNTEHGVDVYVSGIREVRWKGGSRGDCETPKLSSLHAILADKLEITPVVNTNHLSHLISV